MFTNADQLTSDKKAELTTIIDREKPMVVAVCEVKPKNSGDGRQLLDYSIPGYSLHRVNLEEKTGRGIAVFTHESIDKSAIQIKPELEFEEACLLEIRLRGGDLMCFGCLYRSLTPSKTSSDNNDSLNNLLRCIREKNYSHICLVGDLNFRDINWETHSTTHGESSKEAKFIEAVGIAFYINISHNQPGAVEMTNHQCLISY
jgi:exonuclease III